MDMDDFDSKSGELPRQLPGDPRRQAVSSIHGYVYQAWCSIDAWMLLKDEEVIYLEGAEDFDVVRNDTAEVSQVRRTTGTISLGTDKAHVALENFWKLSNREVNRRIDFHYLTTSSIAMEHDADFDGITGIDAWRAAQTNPELARKIAQYLSTKMDVSSSLRSFLISATAELIQERLIRRFHWLTDQPDLDTVKQSVDERITVLLSEQHHPLILISNVRKR